MDKWKRGYSGMTQSEMVIIIRPSFKKVCGPDACRAGLYNHILYRLAKKAKNEPEKDVRKGNIFWFASAEDICQDIDEAWCVNKVRKEIKQLVDAGLLGQRHNPIKKWDRKFQYFLSEEQGKKLLEKCEAEGVCLLHIGLNAEVLHLLHMVNAFNKNGGCICQKEEMELPNMGNASTINGGAIPEGSQPKGSTEGSLSEENESNSNIPNTHTFVSSDTAHASLSQDEQVFTDEKPQGGDQHGQLYTICNFPGSMDYGHNSDHSSDDNPHQSSGNRIPVSGHQSITDSDQGQAASEQITEGDTHHGHRVPTLPAANPAAPGELATSRRPQDHSDGAALPDNGLPVVRAVGSGTTCQEGSRDGRDRKNAERDAAQTLAETPTTPMPAQSLSLLPQAEQAALGAKWNVQAMVAKAEELRGRQFSENARPKEVNAAGKLFKRKADLTQEDFEKAWKLWDTQWWHDNNGLFSITDLAAVPKNKSEMRLIIALEKLALSKAITRQNGQIIPISGTKRYSSYDDPNFRSDQDFYPVEGGSYAAASI